MGPVNCFFFGDEGKKKIDGREGRERGGRVLWCVRTVKEERENGGRRKKK
jgi:hypothetical protein